ncbi:flocculation-associated PEP-CTERM protein PepA [Salinimonas marina]|uniref:Flocculation-associated PEP-CTERM protein PepA n=1 Tax=Salinimonas marina TaxID=2785918 RepID=A0A7S9DYR4_9ALTE|nr:flocculation-associated PEP-CTERM protein PepA [Salinimonas marina]QPG06432.1 flocculation-associated PEP-CTERM protein PepA [Salinimonas marina]
MKLTTIIKSLTLAAGITTSWASHADFLDFQLDETPYGGEVITADKLNGGYTEIINFDSAGNFTTTAFASMNQLFGNNGTANGSQIGSVLGANYSLYATFSANGTVRSLGNSDAGLSLSAKSGSFSLYLDENQDTHANDVATLDLANTSDDKLLGSSDNLAQNFALHFGFIGLFDFMFRDFELVEDGDTYFVSPTPFYMNIRVDGSIGEFEPALGPVKVTGSVSAVFEVPEPSTIAILSLGLLGLGATSRRKS